MKKSNSIFLKTFQLIKTKTISPKRGLAALIHKIYYPVQKDYAKFLRKIRSKQRTLYRQWVMEAEINHTFHNLFLIVLRIDQIWIQKIYSHLYISFKYENLSFTIFMFNKYIILNYILNLHFIINLKTKMNRLSLLEERISSKSPAKNNFKGKTIVVTGGSRGIGLAIAKRCARDGANIAILAKTTQPHPKLPGTIYTAAKQIQSVGGKALPLMCDIRNQKNVQQCIQKVVQTFGGIDILINNASAISLTGTQQTDMKKYDLMHQINTRGTFLVSKICIPYLLKSKNPHILNLSPPLNMDKKWFAPHLAYTMAKYGMSMCVLGMSQQFRDQIAVNALWPRTAIATAAVQNLLGGDQTIKKSRSDQIMSDAAYQILIQDKKQTGNFYIDDQILRKKGVTDFSKYRLDPNAKEEDLMLDFFL